MSRAEPTAFLREVAEQPAALRDLIEFYRGEGQSLLLAWAARARQERRVTFCGMGTSEFAGEVVRANLARLGIDATTLDAGELLHYPRPVAGMPVLISQSGESVETRRIAETLSDRPDLTAIVNNTDSTIARLAGLNLPMLAGSETAISTKTYVNTLAVLVLMAEATRSGAAVAGTLDRMLALSRSLDRRDEVGIDRAASLIAAAPSVHFLARGPAIVCAKQAALTFMEGTRIPAAALTAGAFRHGPFEAVGEGFCAVFFVPGGATHALVEAMASEAADLGASVVAISDRPMALTGDRCQVLMVPQYGEDLFPIAAATTQALLLDAVARKRGLVAGHFRYGQKVTTRE